jgi:predicted Zn-dependent peptidase
MDVSHLEKLTLDHAIGFFRSYYAPKNAILALTGNIKPEVAYDLALKWFGPIVGRPVTARNLPQEPAQSQGKILTVKKNVPYDALYKAWHMEGRLSQDYYSLDVITDLLAGGESGRLYSRLVREKNLFSEINAYITSDIDPGLIVLSGKLMKGTSIDKAETAVKGKE